MAWYVSACAVHVGIEKFSAHYFVYAAVASASQSLLLKVVSLAIQCLSVRMNVCQDFSQENINHTLWSLSEDYVGPGIGIGIILVIFMLIDVPWPGMLS